MRAKSCVLSLALVSVPWVAMRAQETAPPAAAPIADTHTAGSGSPAADVDAPKKIGGSVSVPKLIHSVSPELSAQAREEKLGGVVTVALVVDKKGLPQNIHVTRSAGYGLDEKAVEAVKQYRFKPAMEHGTPVAVLLNIEVHFEIMGNGSCAGNPPRAEGSAGVGSGANGIPCPQ